MKYAALLALFELTFSNGVSAKSPADPRSEFHRYPVTDQHAAAEIARQLASCVVSSKPSAARALLSALTNDQAHKLSSELAGSVFCGSSLARGPAIDAVAVAFPYDIMRGDIAEEFLRREKSEVARLQPLPIQKSYDRSWFALSGRDVAVDEMSACVADTNPAEIRNLLDQPPSTKSEAVAFAELAPFMGRCLRAGTTVDGKREPLRAALAEALYQRVLAPPVATSPEVPQ